MSSTIGRTPVFLQTGFRSGGTWLWSRFRANPESLCFYEPLNEALERITPATNTDLNPERLSLRHPGLAAPYFEEFLPLLAEGGQGIEGYRTEFGLDSYFAKPDEQPAGLVDYLQKLLDFAARKRRQPVLKFTRALARAAWLKHRFPQARQIALIRDPWAQFQSGLSLAHENDNYTFLMTPLFALSRSREESFQALCQSLGIQSVPLSCGIGVCADTYTQLAREMPTSSLFKAFLGMFIASHGKCVPYADLVIAQELLENSVHYQRHVEAKIQGLTGLDVDLSDCRAPKVASEGEPRFDVRAASHQVYTEMQADFPESVAFTRRKLSSFEQ